MESKEGPSQSGFELKFGRGEYITPEKFQEILELNREIIDSNPNLCGIPPLFKKNMLPREEYLWLKRNHPECAYYYESELSPLKSGVIITTGVLGGLGYLIYRLLLRN